MSKANDANGKGNSPTGKKENPMSFHKVAPVKKHRKAAPAPKKAHTVAKPAPKKAAPRRPVGNK
jgi:hypothetical protein